MRNALGITVVLLSVVLVASGARAQVGRHYDFPEMLSSMNPQPPPSLEDAARLSDHKPKHQWRVGKLLMQADTDLSKQWLLAVGSDPNAASATPTKSQGKQIAEATKMANRMKDATGGITQADIKKMSMAEKLAFAEKMRSGMAPQQQQGASMSEMMSVKRADEAFGPAIALMNHLYQSLDSLLTSLNAQHGEVDARKAKALENCPKVQVSGESAPETPCEHAAYEQARTGHIAVENAGLATFSGMVASYKSALMPYLEKAMKAQAEMKDGNAMRTEDGKQQYRLFLGNVLQAIGAVMHNTVSMVDHTTKWQPIS